MKSRLKTIIWSFALLILFAVFFSWIKGNCAAPVPEVSAPGGYYDSPFLLELTAPENGIIYYTLDGSTPSADSTVYQNGIHLSDRTEEPNIYNSIPNVISDWKAFIPSSEPVRKGTVVRAVFVNDWGFTSEILTQTYFVGIPEPENGYTLSLVFDYDALFGDEGIHITGKEYDEWYFSDTQTGEAPLPNFQKDLEVPVIAQVMDRNGEIMNQTVGLKIQGSSARGMQKKRLTMVSRTEYSGSQFFSAQLFEGITSHSVMLKAELPDAIIAELVPDRAVGIQRSVPVRLYFNGEFWIDTYMLERYDSQYFRQHYQVDERELVKAGVSDPDTVALSEGPPYSEFMNWVMNSDYSDSSQWEALQRETSIQSYIDYIAINYYLCNWDFSDDKNYVLWRSTTDGGTQYADMRWRWCLYDIDAISQTYRKYEALPAEINIFSCDLPYITRRVNETALFRSLYQNEDYRKQFVLSFMDIVNNNFAPSRVEKVLRRHGHSLDWMNGFFRNRPAYAAQHLADEFHLTGSLETISIQNAAPEMGSIVVNTSVIDMADGSWSGQYFTDYPVTIRAVANDGYEFIGWKGDATGAEGELTLQMDGGVTLEAVFAKVS